MKPARLMMALAVADNPSLRRKAGERSTRPGILGHRRTQQDEKLLCCAHGCYVESDLKPGGGHANPEGGIFANLRRWDIRKPNDATFHEASGRLFRFSMVRPTILAAKAGA